jgi:hypothetical protein
MEGSRTRNGPSVFRMPLFGLEPAELPTVYCGISLPASTSTARLVADGQVVARSAPVGS